MSSLASRDTAPRPLVVLFDLDGTLIDSLELLVSAMEHAFAGFAAPRPTIDEWVATIGRPLLWQFGQYASSPDDVQLLVQKYRAFQSEHHDRLTRVFPGMPALLQRLRGDGHPMGVVTSKGDALANRSIGHVGLSTYFQAVVGADQTARHKPDPDPILFALQALDREPAEAIYIGDSPFDVLAANAAGVVSIGVTWGAASEDALRRAAPGHVVTSVPELDTLLVKLQHRSTP